MTTLQDVWAMLQVEKDPTGEGCNRAKVLCGASAKRGEGYAVGELRRRIVEDPAERTHTGATKTEAREAPVPVIAPPRAILTELRAVDGNQLTGPILCGKRGKPLNLDNLEPTSHQTCVGRCGNRVARLQSTTTLAKDNGLAAKAVLRHSTLATTDHNYIQAIPAETLAAMNELERQFADCADASVMQTTLKGVVN